MTHMCMFLQKIKITTITKLKRTHYRDNTVFCARGSTTAGAGALLTTPVRYETILLRPVQRAFHGALPTRVEAVALILAHLWLKGAVDSPVLCAFLRTAPETYGDTCEIGGTEGGSFGDLRTLDGHTEDVCLELHEQVIDNCAAIDA